MLRLLSLLFFCCTLLAQEGDVIEREQWFSGYLNKQPAMNAHEVITKHANGTRSIEFQTKIKIARKLMGFNSVIEIAQRRSFKENKEGYIQSFHFEDSENGKIVTAIGEIKDGKIVATITRPLGSTQQTLEIPKGKHLLGQQTGQEQMNKLVEKVGNQMDFIGVEMISGRLTIIKSTATLKQILNDNHKLFDIRIDLLPMLPAVVEVDEHGHTVSMKMSMGGFLTIELHATDEPVRLKAANFAINNALRHKGGIPRSGDNHYKLKQEIIDNLEADEFQKSEDGVLIVSNLARKTQLKDGHGFLKKELQLELDDPELKQWAEKMHAPHKDKSVAVRAEMLRLAARAHIVRKDLSQGDASALETFKSRRGDCTEHANLLCAALRINGIPSRTEVGFVYATDMRTWVGHAWTSAYDSEQGRWIHLDAAYPGLQRSQYIKTAASSGGDSSTTAQAMARGMAVLMGQEIEVLTK